MNIKIRKFRSGDMGKILEISQDSFLQPFKKNGIKTVSVHVRPSNKTGLSLLQSFAFRIVKTVENYYTDSESAYLLKENLDG